MPYIIKQLPEDFKVEEISSLESTKGEFTYFVLTKRNYTTEAAIQSIARYLKIKRKFFGYAGNKDKRAVTKQLCSVKGRTSNLKLDDIEIEVVGRSNKPISLGDLEGNKFEIVIRNIVELPKKIKYIVNYFDSQRFGIKGNNHIIGKLIVTRDFKGAVELIDNQNVITYLKDYPNDYIGALRTIPKKILMMYVHAYQSDVWNRCVEELIQIQKKDFSVEIPVVGFGTELEGKVGSLIKQVLESEGIQLQDFVIREVPELSSEGTSRKVWVMIKELNVGELEEDELNNGMKKVKITFSLPKGSYATIVIKEMFRR